MISSVITDENEIANTTTPHPLLGKTVLFIRTSGLGRLPHYERLKRLGATLWCFEQFEKPAFAHVFDEWIIGNAFDEVAAVESISRYIKHNAKRKPHGVLTFDEFGVAVCAATCEALNLPGLPVEVMRQTRNKYNFRAMCANAGIPSVPFRGINLIEDATHVEACTCSAARQSQQNSTSELEHDMGCSYMQFPVVFKPCEGGGSQFVQLVHDAEALSEVVATALRQTRENPNPNPTFEWVLMDPDRPQSPTESDKTTKAPSLQPACVEVHTVTAQATSATEFTDAAGRKTTQTQADRESAETKPSTDKPQTQAGEEFTQPSPSRDKPMFMAEGLLEGIEVDCDVLVMDGQVVFLSISTNIAPQTPDYFMEMGGICPSDLPQKAQQKIVGVVRKLFHALSAITSQTETHSASVDSESDNEEACNCDCDCECNIACTLPHSVTDALAGRALPTRPQTPKRINGCFHVELMYTAKGPVPIEVNCRLGGAETHLMVNTAWGVSLSEGAVLLACGYDVSVHLDGLQAHVASVACSDPEMYDQKVSVQRPCLTPLNMTPLHTVSSRNLVPYRSGIIKQQEIPQYVAEDEAFVDCALYYETGATVAVPPDGFQYLGWVVVRETALYTSEQNLKRLTDLCTFAIDAQDTENPTENTTERRTGLSFGLREGSRGLSRLFEDAEDDLDLVVDVTPDTAVIEPVSDVLHTSQFDKSHPEVQQAVRDITRVLSLKGTDTFRARIAACTSLAESRRLLSAGESVLGDSVNLKLNDCYCIRRCCHGNVLSETSETRALNQRVS